MASRHIGGAILGTGGYGAVHTMSDILDAHDFDRAQDAVVRAVVLSPGLAARVIHRRVKVTSLVRELRSLAVYKQATAPASSPAKVPGLNDDAQALMLIAMYASMAEANGSCHRLGGVAALAQVLPYVVVVPADMPDLAAALTPARGKAIVLILSMRLQRGSKVHSELAIIRRMEGSMEDLEGVKSLLTVRDVLSAARAVLDALSIMNCTGASHRDVKPNNILYRRVGGRLQFMLTDFGLVTWEQKRVNMGNGTPGYMSPLVYASRTEYLQHFSTQVSQSGIPGLGAGEIWDSFKSEVRQRELAIEAAHPMRGGEPVGQEEVFGADADMNLRTMIQRTHQKNDLYAVGMVFLKYMAKAPARAGTQRAGSKRSAQDALHGYAVRLILGGAGGNSQRDNGIWTVSAALVELNRLELAIGSSGKDQKVTVRGRE